MSSSYNMYNITKDHYVLRIPSGAIPQLSLGRGLDLNDPSNPVARQAPFASDGEILSVNNDVLDLPSILASSSSFLEDMTDYELATTLNANMSAAFSFGSLDVAYSHAKDMITKSDVILALITQTNSGPMIPDKWLMWKNAPTSQSANIKNDDDRLHQFISDYGSHYIESIEYGYRIAVFGKLDSKVQSDIQSFRGAFKAAFSFGSGAASISTSTRETLSHSNIELRAEVDAGAIDPPQSIVLTGIDQIRTFLDNFQQQKIKVYRGPIEVHAQSYWHTLRNYSKTQALLAQVKGTPAEAPFGVPAGTVIAWAPPPGSETQDASGAITIEPPMGWAICDGRSGTPNLVDRFIFGTIEARQIETVGGSKNHTHQAGTHYPEDISWPSTPYLRGAPASQGTADLFTGQGHTHTISTDDALPPFLKLLYIMKLY
jgi:hypothetical protein